MKEIELKRNYLKHLEKDKCWLSGITVGFGDRGIFMQVSCGSCSFYHRIKAKFLL